MSTKNSITVGDLVSALPGRPGATFLLSTSAWLQCDSEAEVESAADAIFAIKPGSLGTVIENRTDDAGNTYAFVMFSCGAGWVRHEKLLKIN